MPGKPTYVVQTFKLLRGRLMRGEMIAALSESGALKRAEAEGKRLPGAVALCIVTDPETSEVQAATILGTFGEVPEDFAETLLG